MNLFDARIDRDLHAAPLDVLVGPNDSRYPAGEPRVIDLRITGEELLHALRLPESAWYPLLGTPRAFRLLIHLNLPAGSRAAAGISRLARKFSNVHFIVDAFAQNAEPAEGWQSQVRLAEAENVWLTTRGLASWPHATAAEALYFVVGEVGAGKLLYASDGTPVQSPADWLRSFPILDEAQRELILHGNAAELLTKPD
jgi:hypothetical protein